MTADTAQKSPDLPCYRCGYDLRAHPADGKCPECEASVAESRRLAAIPFRPAWRGSDPRWRRRILAGVWLLVFLPLMDVLLASGWASSIPAPPVFDFRGRLTLDQTFLSSIDLYASLIFCMGVVLLFSKERERRRGPFDWTRRWGVICSYVVLLLSVTGLLLISALVLVGISALFMSMPAKYQPGVTRLFVNVSSAYLYYGPFPKDIASVVLDAFSSIVILLGCLPLFDALRSSGPRRAAVMLLAPLALFSVGQLVQDGWFCLVRFLHLSSLPPPDVSSFGMYFRPVLLLKRTVDWPRYTNASEATSVACVVEASKWCIVLAIAVWLTVAQCAGEQQRKETHSP